MTIEFKGGRKPFDSTKPKLRLARFLTGVPAAETKDWLSKVDYWPMYLNDQIGDCTCATAGHSIQIVTAYGQGSTVTISDEDVLMAYMDVSGYDPRTGEHDDGAVEQEVLNYWRTVGIGGHKITAFAFVDPQNRNELKRALELFGVLYIGIDFPNTAMDQFDNGEPWDVVPGAYLEGGHAINAGYYDGDSWKVVTWGAVQEMTQAFWDKYVEEAWVVITPEWLRENKNPDGIDLAELGTAFSDLTGEPNPFPDVPPLEPPPLPVPEPAPLPAPGPEPDPKVEPWYLRLLDWLIKLFSA